MKLCFLWNLLAANYYMIDVRSEELLLERVIVEAWVVWVLHLLLLLCNVDHFDDFLSVSWWQKFFMKRARNFFGFFESEEMSFDDVNVAAEFLAKICNCWWWNLKSHGKTSIIARTIFFRFNSHRISKQKSFQCDARVHARWLCKEGCGDQDCRFFLWIRLSQISPQLFSSEFLLNRARKKKKISWKTCWRKKNDFAAKVHREFISSYPWHCPQHQS